MSNYTTPGVYVEEISTLPPSVAQVATAIPAFIGYTAKGPLNSPTRISSMLEYESIFGGPKMSDFSVSYTTDANTGVTSIGEPSRTSTDSFILYYCMKLFFANGGGSCYIVSVGAYGTKSQNDFSAGLSAIEKVDEPTLLLLTDALSLGTVSYGALCQMAMTQCAKLKDRFTIIDIEANDSDGSTFRNQSLGNLSYGAAYTPHLLTSMTYEYAESGVTVIDESVSHPTWTKSINLTMASGSGTIEGAYAGDSNTSPRPKIKIESASANSAITFEEASNRLTIKLPDFSTGVTLQQIMDAWANASPGNFSLSTTGDTGAQISSAPTSDQNFDAPAASSSYSMADLETSNTYIYNLVKAKLTSVYITLPPSAAMAGIYARVDGTRGVWKAPANEVLAGVIGPAAVISHEEQGRLNVDPTSGKSINAIRSFTGKGTLVWGARTLAGNDNEWRYINVRRLFITIEESVQKASAFAVFEANDATTWLKVKAMIDNYLYGLWQQGALAGPTPEASYFVNVGLGKTMTNQDILEGRMIVDIGIAAVRPAEFIVLRFSHKLQEA
ncbi:MAG: phage tail sheath C-terminal domain-containing protein [Bacteroidota bacterium]